MESDRTMFSDDQRLAYGSKKEPYPTEYEALLGVQKNLVYPKSVFFIIVNEFCERFSFYGMRAILTLYLHNMLKYTENATTVIYHSFVMFSYLTCVPGAILADSFLGKFKTIFYLSIVYAIGNATMCFASVGTTPSMSWIPTVPVSFVGLALIAIGTGGIKPCVSAFGGDQFHIPGQEKALEQFFFLFYFAINMGSMISVFVTPILRKDVSCLDSDTCYPLAFGLPAILMVTAVVIFLIGKPFYKMKRPSGNVIVQVTKCVYHALANRKKNSHFIRTANEHWLDNANDKYDDEFIGDVKKLFSILVLFAPLPVFWALFEQQGSRWTLQATKMNGVVFNGWTIKPDQMQVVNSFMVLLFIPLFDQLLYPALAKCNLLKKPLQRIALGGFLASLSFILAGLVELKLEPTYAVLPGPAQAQINFINTLPCQFNISLLSTVNNGQLFAHKSLLQHENVVLKLPAPNSYSVVIQPEPQFCHVDDVSVDFSEHFNIVCEFKKVMSILIGINEKYEGELKYSSEGDDLMKSRDGNAKLKIIMDPMESELNNKIILHSLISPNTNYNFNLNSSLVVSSPPTQEVQPDLYSVRLVNDATSEYILLGEVNLEAGGVYLLAIYPDWSNNSNAFSSRTKMKLIEQTEPNSVHMLYLLPQYFVITIAEILFSITGYAFSYSEAPAGMKSVIQAIWLLTNATGSLILILVTEFNLFPRQMIQFFFFSGLMFIATVIFIVFAYRYKPIQPHKPASIFMRRTTLPVMDNFFQLSETDFSSDEDK